MSDITGTARWSGPSADMAGKRRAWLACLIALVAMLVFGNLANYAVPDMNYGWDARVNCAAVDAHVDGLDPYYVKNLKGTKFSYTYLPATLDAFRPLCAGGFLVGHQRGVFLAIALLCSLLLPGIGRTRSLRDVALRGLYVLGAFVGFEWVLASGNFAILSGGLTAAALALLLRPAKSDDQHDVLRMAGAALLGARDVVQAGLLPIAGRALFSAAVAAAEACSDDGGGPRLRAADLDLGRHLSRLVLELVARDHGRDPRSALGPDRGDQSIAAAVGAGHRRPRGACRQEPPAFAIYALAATALVLAPLGWSLLRAIRSSEGSLPTRLDRWLIDHPQAAMRITVLAMYGLYLCSPRLKEYAFFESAVYAAVLIVDLPAAALAAVLTIGVAVPTLVSITGTTIEGGFVQLAVALMCFWIMLLDFRAEPTRLAQQQGVRP